MPPVSHEPTRLVDVPPDHYQVVTDDAVLSAALEATLAICLYDAVEEPGALLHLRFIARGAEASDVTDRTLATDLLLLDRCVTELRETLPRTPALQGRLVAAVTDDAVAKSAAEAVMALVQEYLKDSEVAIVSFDVGFGAQRQLRFRPSMGEVRVA
jgi:chemotaxis receptor (MCP) glutamine deamidase CheD